MSSLRSLPKNSPHRRHFYFKPTNYFSVVLEHLMLLEANNPEGFHWLIWPRKPQDIPPAEFFVIPNSVIAKLLSDVPLKCTPWKTGHSRVKATEWKLRVSKSSLNTNPVSQLPIDLKEYRNNVSLFNSHIWKSWHLLRYDGTDKAADLLPPRTNCPRCGKETFPCQFRYHFDVQCRNANCHLWRRGIGHGEQDQGDWVYDSLGSQWIKWDKTRI